MNLNSLSYCFTSQLSMISIVKTLISQILQCQRRTTESFKKNRRILERKSENFKVCHAKVLMLSAFLFVHGSGFSIRWGVGLEWFTEYCMC
jgi:hypothetical protein